MAVEATGFAANVADFVTLSGDLGFKKSGATIIAVGADVTAALAAGPVSVSLSDADFGLQASEGKTAFELKNGQVQRDDRRAGERDGDSVLVQYTGAGPRYGRDGADGGRGRRTRSRRRSRPNTVAVEATGFAANVADFVTLSGDLGFKKSGATIIAVGSDVTAALAAGPANVSLSDADFGLQGPGRRTAFELKNGTFSATIDGLASVTADSVLVQYTGAGPRYGRGRR